MDEIIEKNEPIELINTEPGIYDNYVFYLGFLLLFFWLKFWVEMYYWYNVERYLLDFQIFTMGFVLLVFNFVGIIQGIITARYNLIKGLKIIILYGIPFLLYYMFIHHLFFKFINEPF